MAKTGLLVISTFDGKNNLAAIDMSQQLAKGVSVVLMLIFRVGRVKNLAGASQMAPVAWQV